MDFEAFARQVLQLQFEAGQHVESYVGRHGSFSLEVRLRPQSVETRGGGQSRLNASAEVFKQNAETPKKRGVEELKDGIGKSQPKILTGTEKRKKHALKRELEAVQVEVKEAQNMLEAKGIFNQHDFNWTPPSVSQETLSGLKTLIRHSRRKVTAMRKLLESVPEVSAKDKSTTEKLDEGRKGGGDSKDTEAQVNQGFYWMLQCLSDGEGEPPREEILKELGVTKERWRKTFRVLTDDEPRDDDLKWLEMSKEDVFEFKRALAYMNAFGIGYEEKMRKYWNAFRDGCKGRDVSGMG